MSNNTRLILPLIAAVAFSLSGTVSAEEEVIATVNGAKITKQDMQRFAFEATQGLKGNPQLDPNDVLSELVSRELIYQDALKQGYDKHKEVVAELARLQRKVLVGFALEEVAKKSPVTDQEIQALYDSDVKNLKLKEYRARHILLADQTKAEQIITELDLGGDFAKLAEKYSIDTTTAKKGGELDWFKPQRMVAEFSNATALLDKGKYTKVPVKSQYGWHIIKLEDSRDVPPPSLEQIKPKLVQALQQQRVGKYISALQQKAEIKLNKK